MASTYRSATGSKLVAVDLCGTVASNRDRFARVHAAATEHTDLNRLPVEQIRSIMSPRSILADEPMPLVAALSGTRHQLVFVSSRPYWTFSATRLWLARHGMSGRVRLRRRSELVLSSVEYKTRILSVLRPDVFVDDEERVRMAAEPFCGLVLNEMEAVRWFLDEST